MSQIKSSMYMYRRAVSPCLIGARISIKIFLAEGRAVSHSLGKYQLFIPLIGLSIVKRRGREGKLLAILQVESN